MSKPKIAIVHDWIYGGGAEKVVLEIHKLYPDAPIYTSFCSDEWRERLDNKVVTGYLQRWPFSKISTIVATFSDNGGLLSSTSVNSTLSSQALEMARQNSFANPDRINFIFVIATRQRIFIGGTTTNISNDQVFVRNGWRA